MWDFIVKNYEWIFSGIGISMLIAFFKIFEKLKNFGRSEPDKKTIFLDKTTNSGNIINLSSSDNNNIQVVNNQTHHVYNKDHSKLTKTEISNIEPRQTLDDIQSAPLLQQEYLEESFVGLRVKWIVRLNLLFSRDNKQINVACKPDDDNVSYPTINFLVNVDDYPFFKIARSGKKLEVIGKIIKYKGFHIDLEIESIKQLN